MEGGNRIYRDVRSRGERERMRVLLLSGRVFRTARTEGKGTAKFRILFAYPR